MRADGLCERARRSLEIAEHLLLRTYPLVNEPKLVLAIADEVYSALTGSMVAVISKSGVGIESDFDQCFKRFSDVAYLHGFDDSDLSLLSDVRRIIKKHKESPVEFVRDGGFVICDKNYVCDFITIDYMRGLLSRTKVFVDKAFEHGR